MASGVALALSAAWIDKLRASTAYFDFAGAEVAELADAHV